MAEKKDKKTPTASPSSKGGQSSGGRKKSRQNREARRCRKAIRHLESRGRPERALRVRGHLNMILKGEKPQDLGRSRRRYEDNQRVEAKLAAKRLREAAKHAGSGTPQPPGQP